MWSQFVPDNQHVVRYIGSTLLFSFCDEKNIFSAHALTDNVEEIMIWKRKCREEIHAAVRKERTAVEGDPYSPITVRLNTQARPAPVAL
jgi:hypothetical protein